MHVLRGLSLFTAVVSCISITAASADLRARSTAPTRSAFVSVPAPARHVRTRAPNTSAATWKMPWQISPIAYGRHAHRERVVEAIVPKTGRVRGTPAAIATIGRSLRPARGPNRTVAACRATVSKEARKLGAKEVEAVSAGRERRAASHTFVAPVNFRITYRKRDTYEVRLSTLRCVVDRRGTILNASVVSGKSRRFS